MKENKLSIRLHGQPIGILEQNDLGQILFSYQNDSTNPISIGMPIREEPYKGQQVEAFFGGLLPESEEARKLIGKYYHVSPYNSYALLKAIGYDCAGAISCHGIDEPVLTQSSFVLKGKFLSNECLYEHIKQLPKKPLFIDVEGVRLSLAGVQDKAAVCLIDNQITLPEGSCPTTHILKPTPTQFEELGVNEYFCMRLAKHVGLPVADVSLHKLKDIQFLLVERYDRHISNNQVTRIHQEDFCQALGVLTSRKYQNEGGPGFKDLFELLNQTAIPAIDRNHLARAIVFNALIGNMDAHGKNFSLLHHSSGAIKLAPFYDLVCTRVYEGLTARMAMKIGSKYNSDEVLPRHWEQLCESINYRYLAMEKLINDIAKKLLKAAYQEKAHLHAQGINSKMVEKIISFIEKNIDFMLRRFEHAAK
ncbi:type II toxin-antitoxin system HipA family toxin [Legionella impletisoli]|uniref:Transcriptional regulator n=1 Tax=Legionella impletisoli TaxID=343510 RepID=A0A917N863_9GAMM|nr:type II toxin-antitoxin system HipA family toxin [Legionella impletisoli]GGI76953.1 transcriptional regulator [Legionella impletisoli]